MGEIRHIQVIDVCFDDVDSTVLASFPKRTRKKEPQKPFVAFGREVAETPFGRVGLLSNMAMALQQAPRRPCRVDGHGLQSPNTELGGCRSGPSFCLESWHQAPRPRRS